MGYLELQCLMQVQVLGQLSIERRMEEIDRQRHRLHEGEAIGSWQCWSNLWLTLFVFHLSGLMAVFLMSSVLETFFLKSMCFFLLFEVRG